MSAPLSPTSRRHHQPARARKAIKVGEHGEITVVPLGTHSSGREVIVPAPASDGGDAGSYPSDRRPGKRAKVPTADGGLDHKRAPSDEDVEALLAALRADPWRPG